MLTQHCYTPCKKNKILWLCPPRERVEGRLTKFSRYVPLEKGGAFYESFWLCHQTEGAFNKIYRYVTRGLAFQEILCFTPPPQRQVGPLTTKFSRYVPVKREKGAFNKISRYVARGQGEGGHLMKFSGIRPPTLKFSCYVPGQKGKRGINKIFWLDPKLEKGESIYSVVEVTG